MELVKIVCGMERPKLKEGEVCIVYPLRHEDEQAVLSSVGKIELIRTTSYMYVSGIDKEAILIAVDKLTFPVILLHGAAMVMHGVKELTSDIDAIPMVKNPNKIDLVEYKEGKIELGLFDFGLESCELKDLPNIEFEMINGCMVQTLDNIIKHKEALGRPKDFEAIALIREFQNQ